ncbi:hypothetical protein ACFQ1S_44115 [Kibdelosporangium lantanae]|uniref:Uncharacterized protein n=1 Tax=Kibdelosporangium lantanae TaxID=1497396 RepID=A0ABW3MRF2_9PSEU
MVKAYGITPDGASLVRPDFVVAWRTQDANGDLSRVLDEVLSRV